MIKITGTFEEIYILKQLMLRRLLNDTVEAKWEPTKSGAEFRADLLGKEIEFEVIR